MVLEMLSFHLEPAHVTGAVIILTLYLVLYKLQTVKSHPNEPPIVASGIPFVGHLLGMGLKGGRYIKQIGFVSNSDEASPSFAPYATLPAYTVMKAL